MKHWIVLESRYLLKRWWMNLRVDRVQLPSGAELDEFHVVEYPDWVAVLCITREGKVLMVEQYRHGVGATSLELPAGAIDPGEDPLEAARRELLEETGFAADVWHCIGRCAPEPSKHSNHAYFYVALDAVSVREQELDETEHLEVRALSQEEVLSLALHGGILHGTQLSGILLAHLKGWLAPASVTRAAG